MTGRPTDYREELAELICDRIADGESLKAICADEGMPHRATVFRWLAVFETFRDMYAHAREEQAETLADEIVGISDEECTTVRAIKHGSSDDDGEGNTEVVFDSTAVARNRLRVDARKWVAAKLKPRKYGDKIQQELSGPGGGPVGVMVSVTVNGVEPGKA
ncbi:terminase small subunit protein [Stenotrophomonas sp. NPDC078853]|uniref:terminase small subunit-like protein n=1 Tax=Stenotrophomonas sp. NPDC078853 TaxID=3364534 RepID=UPI003850DD3B